MEIREMETSALEERAAAISAEAEVEGADLDALETEARAIKDELEARKAAAAEKVEERKLALEEGKTIEKEKKEERKMDTIEIRKSHEYNVAFANYIKSNDDSECRALLSENATGGTVPVPVYVEDRIRTAWDRDTLTRRVKRTFVKGNLKVGYESLATDAVVHEEGDEDPVAEETLTLGIVELVPESIKKWISISDEALDLAGEAFLDYIYDELTYKIAAKLAEIIVTEIGTSALAPSITAAPAADTLINAAATLAGEATNKVAIMNAATYAAFKGVQFGLGYGADIFDGMEVIINNSLPAYGTATAGAVYAIVGDLSGYQCNFPNGEEINIRFDNLTLAEYDLVKVIGRCFVGHGVVAPKFFATIKKPA